MLDNRNSRSITAIDMTYKLTRCIACALCTDVFYSDLLAAICKAIVIMAAHDIAIFL